jgi:hypothetical protein
MFCKECKILHTELPDIIQPYKHYDSQTIQCVLDGNDESTQCAADNSTIYRWKKEYSKSEPDISQRLASVHAQQSDAIIPIAQVSDISNKIRRENERWLAFVMMLLINGGHKIRTRFAFCPVMTSDIVSIGATQGCIEGRKNVKTIDDSS